MTEIQEIQKLLNKLTDELDDEQKGLIESLVTRYGRLMFREGAKTFEENQKSNMVGGIKTPPELIDLISVLYPEYDLCGSSYALQKNRRRINMLRADYRLLLKKEELAISGAMRWEFSQEAPLWIHTSDGFRDYKTAKSPNLNDMID